MYQINTYPLSLLHVNMSNIFYSEFYMQNTLKKRPQKGCDNFCNIFREVFNKHLIMFTNISTKRTMSKKIEFYGVRSVS